MGLVAERILIRYKEFERRKELAQISIQSRQAIVAAGIYENSIDYLNEAVDNYQNLIYFVDNPKAYVSKNKSNAELFEEWKRIFGKIDETPSS
jgi:hypothetical protein